MSVGILLVTHENIGAGLVAVSEAIFKQAMPGLNLVSIPSDLEPDDLGRYADQIRAGRPGQVRRPDSRRHAARRPGRWPTGVNRRLRRNTRQPGAAFQPSMQRPGGERDKLADAAACIKQSLEELCQTALNGGRDGVRQDRE
jgi:hypothetical protein